MSKHTYGFSTLLTTDMANSLISMVVEYMFHNKTVHVSDCKVEVKPWYEILLTIFVNYISTQALYSTPECTFSLPFFDTSSYNLRHPCNDYLHLTGADSPLNAYLTLRWLTDGVKVPHYCSKCQESCLFTFAGQKPILKMRALSETRHALHKRVSFLLLNIDSNQLCTHKGVAASKNKIAKHIKQCVVTVTQVLHSKAMNDWRHIGRVG